MYLHYQIELRVLYRIEIHEAYRGDEYEPFQPAHPITDNNVEKKGEEWRSFREATRIFLTLERSKVRSANEFREGPGSKPQKRAPQRGIAHKKKAQVKTKRHVEKEEESGIPEMQQGRFSACQGWELAVTLFALYARVSACVYVCRAYIFSRRSVAFPERGPHAHRHKYVPAL